MSKQPRALKGSGFCLNTSSDFLLLRRDRIQSVRQVRLAYNGSPTSNITRRDMVSVSSVGTRHTKELRLSTTISFINTTASWAGSGRVSRVNRLYSYACEPRLVSDKASQLKESPTMQSSTLGATNSYSVSDTAKFLYGNTLSECLRTRYYALRYYVVRVACKTRFLAPPHLQETFGGPRAFGLQLAQAHRRFLQAIEIGGFSAETRASDRTLMTLERFLSDIIAMKMRSE